MIASLSGTVAAVQHDGAVIQCGGVGYFVIATPQTLGTLARGEEATVLTTLVVREDALTLYGFATAEERSAFGLLQTVNGLGPRLALATLAVLSPAELAAAVSASDVKTLQRIPGVGKRMAERMSLELKEKVAAFAAGAEDGTATAPPAVAAAGDLVPGQVTEALIGLGFSERQAAATVAKVAAEEPAADTAAMLKKSLALLGRKN